MWRSAWSIGDDGPPAEVGAGVVDLRHAILHVLVALAVVRVGRGLDERDAGGAVTVLGERLREREHHRRDLPDRIVVRRVADVVDLARRDTLRVGDDPHQRRDAVVDVRERAFLRAAVDEPDRLAPDDVAEELRDDARAAFLRRVDRIEAGADPVERAEQRVVEALLHPVGVDHAVHQLLRARIDPARLVDRTEHQVRRLRIERGVGAHPVHLGRRREHQTLAVADRGADDRQVRLEIELEHAQRLAHVRRGRGNRHQRQHDVALLDVVLDPLAVDRDVALEEVETLVWEQRLDTVRLHVHSVDLPVGRAEDRAGQMVADEAVDAEDQDSFHCSLPAASSGGSVVWIRSSTGPVKKWARTSSR